MQLASQQDLTLDELIAFGLEQVSQRFNRELRSDLACVNRLAGHIEQYRGKMLRPQLVLVSALACGPGIGDSVACGDSGDSGDSGVSGVSGDSRDSGDSRVSGVSGDSRDSGGNGASGGSVGSLGCLDDHYALATVVEMVHMATLVHDDILDDAHVRRRGQTVNFLQGNETAVMLGDYLISHAYHLCSSMEQVRPDGRSISQVIAQTTNTVCEGELLQLSNRNNWQLDEKTYFQIIGRKTASLCGACCELAAVIHQSPQQVTDCLKSYGQKVGVAFQIIDDLLDLVGNEAMVGKSLGRDLEKGKLTLPLIHHLQTSSDPKPMLALLDLGSTASQSMPSLQRTQAICQMIHQSGAVDYARQYAAKLIKQTQQELEILPDSGAKAMLISMAQAVLTRRF